MAGIMELLGMALGTFLIFSTLSMLYKDNVFFRVGQMAVMGSSIAHFILYNMKNVYNNAWTPLMNGDIMMIIPLILGLLMYTRLRRSTAWLARYPSSVLVGIGTGVMVAGTVSGQILDQIAVTMTDVLNWNTSGGSLINAIIIAVGVVTSITFFVFTKEHTGVVGKSASIGRKFLMISLGANWSGELVWYLTQLVGRLMYIKNFVTALMGG
ncbi:MAG: hypothetical protein NWE89_02950 [Candidatus Bathyarchaeota archaeon]|nr:hypothetical protein [Candidatus Bathyarchaeota archaeon]